MALPLVPVYRNVRIVWGEEGTEIPATTEAPLPVTIVASDITLVVEDLTGVDVTDRANRVLGRVGVDILTGGAMGDGALAKDATLANVQTTNAKRFGGLKTSAASVISTNGDNTIHTPASGKKITLYWIGMSASQNNASEVLATVKLGSKIVYEWYMGNPGAFAHWEPVVADNANDALVVNLSAGGQSVAVNVTYTEA